MRLSLTNGIFILLSCLCMTILSCSDAKDEPQDGDAISISTDIDNPAHVTLSAEKNAQITIDFDSRSNWKASVDVEWATVSPMTGQAGEASVTVVTKESNLTGDERRGKLTLTSGNTSKEVEFIQQGKDVLNLEQTTFDLTPDEQDISFRFSSNVKGKKVLYILPESAQSWIKPKKDANSRALEESEYIVTVLANDTREKREAKFQIEIVDENSGATLISSSWITVTQQGQAVGTSTDYSADGSVKKLYTHTEGNGIPVVLIGDGFIDREIANGLYSDVMSKAFENLFTEEPVKTLKKYFDVWAVTAVSRNNAFGNDYRTAIECKLEGGSSIKGSESKVYGYLDRISELSDISKRSETLVVVVLNTEVHAGTTAFGYEMDGKMSNFAIAYCPMVEGLESEQFREVLTHESIGHGLAKLWDEYSYESMGAISTQVKNQVANLQSQQGWAMNVSVNSGVMPWQHLLDDSRYQQADAYGETLGIYEGACSYPTGAWRPTNESMMRGNIHGFNAPSREAIYKRVMASAYGSSWTYDYETFVAFDQAHQPAPSRHLSIATACRPLGSPIVTHRPLR